MQRVLNLAGLPAHFTPHSLRHTFCSLLVSEGVSPVYVQQQAGHQNIQMTVSVYGSWFATKAPGAMDRLALGVPAGPVVTKQAQSGNNMLAGTDEPLLPTGTCGGGPLSRPSPG
jgi:hypothetical protein